MKIFGYDITIQITKGGMPLKRRVTKELEQCFLDNLREGDYIYTKIYMIKKCRELMGIGLREAKDLIENRFGMRLEVLARKFGKTIS